MYRHVVGNLIRRLAIFTRFLALLYRVTVNRVSATSDRRSICAKGLVMELYDSLGDKLFLYTRGILPHPQC